MAKTIQHTIKPKEIDESNNETDLDQYTVSNSYDIKTAWQAELVTADKLIVLPVSDDHVAVELISDQNLTLQILTGASVTMTLTNIKNMFLNFGTDQNYSYKIKNISGSDANIIWRLYA